MESSMGGDGACLKLYVFSGGRFRKSMTLSCRSWGKRWCWSIDDQKKTLRSCPRRERHTILILYILLLPRRMIICHTWSVASASQASIARVRGEFRGKQAWRYTGSWRKPIRSRLVRMCYRGGKRFVGFSSREKMVDWSRVWSQDG